MTAVRRCALLYGLVKRQMLERMQCIVMDEYPNRSLRWQIVGRVLDEMSHTTRRASRVVRAVIRGLGRINSSRVGLRRLRHA
jgi:hypothetical protein